jgi:NADPH2:quinone reductase
MRAVWWTNYGPPSVLTPGDAPDPVPGPGQVLVRVESAGIPFIETQIRAGRSPKSGTVRPPAILGGSVGGVVAATGERVVTSTGGSGGYAELAVADESELVPVPESRTIQEAAALFSDGRTALGLHEVAAPRRGETVLVEAAGGGLGILLVQLAVAAGATVIAAASDPRKLDLATAHGAAHTVNYGEPGWEKGLEADLVYDGVGGQLGRTALGIVRPGGRFVVHGLASGAPTDTSGADRITVVGLAQLAEIGKRSQEHSAAALADERLRPVIGQTYPLDKAADAHEAMESRTALGKTLLLT